LAELKKPDVMRNTALYYVTQMLMAAKFAKDNQEIIHDFLAGGPERSEHKGKMIECPACFQACEQFRAWGVL